MSILVCTTYLECLVWTADKDMALLIWHNTVVHFVPLNQVISIEKKATESAWRDNVDKVMAQINTKDLSQILIKETAADTNDVFNVLILWGAKGGLAVAGHLINVLNISIPFHHVPRSLNSPSLLVLLLDLFLSLPKCLFSIIWGGSHPLPRFTRWTWRSTRLCFYVPKLPVVNVC